MLMLSLTGLALNVDGQITYLMSHDYPSQSSVQLVCSSCPSSCSPPQLCVASTTSSIPHLTTISRECQLNDDSIGIIFKSVEADKGLPEDVLKRLISKSRSLHQQWDMMQVKHGKLLRKLLSSDGIISNLQLVVPHLLCHHNTQRAACWTGWWSPWPRQAYQQAAAKILYTGLDAKQCCNTCLDCASHKTNAPHKQASLNTTKTGASMQTVVVDILRPFPDSPTGNRYI